MNRMDCQEVRDLLNPYEDGELPDSERSAIAQHVGECQECAAALTGLQALRRRIDEAGTFAVPTGMRERVLGAVAGEAAAVPSRRRQHILTAAAIAVIAMVSGAIGYGLGVRQDQTAAVARDVVTAHVRSLLDDRLVQVAIGDTHTLRPWLAGRLPFAPEIPELSSRGFPLLGVRLDYLLDRRVAVIGYGRRKHRISVFVFPAEHSNAVARVEGSRNGFNVIGWTHGEFAYLAVSDLNAGELSDLKTALVAGR
jgi:anti-sigma factor (TIGR02949 family)